MPLESSLLNTIKSAVYTNFLAFGYELLCAMHKSFYIIFHHQVDIVQAQLYWLTTHSYRVDHKQWCRSKMGHYRVVLVAFGCGWYSVRRSKFVFKKVFKLNKTTRKTTRIYSYPTSMYISYAQMLTCLITGSVENDKNKNTRSILIPCLETR